jgi:hypothetical protein
MDPEDTILDVALVRPMNEASLSFIHFLLIIPYLTYLFLIALLQGNELRGSQPSVMEQFITLKQERTLVSSRHTWKPDTF